MSRTVYGQPPDYGASLASVADSLGRMSYANRAADMSRRSHELELLGNLLRMDRPERELYLSEFPPEHGGAKGVFNKIINALPFVTKENVDEERINSIMQMSTPVERSSRKLQQNLAMQEVMDIHKVQKLHEAYKNSFLARNPKTITTRSGDQISTAALLDPTQREALDQQYSDDPTYMQMAALADNSVPNENELLVITEATRGIMDEEVGAKYYTAPLNVFKTVYPRSVDQEKASFYAKHPDVLARHLRATADKAKNEADHPFTTLEAIVADEISKNPQKHSTLVDDYIKHKFGDPWKQSIMELQLTGAKMQKTLAEIEAREHEQKLGSARLGFDILKYKLERARKENERLEDQKQRLLDALTKRYEIELDAYNRMGLVEKNKPIGVAAQKRIDDLSKTIELLEKGQVDTATTPSPNPETDNATMTDEDLLNFIENELTEVN